MPYRIIRPCIFMDVKPYQLIAALMAREGLGPLPLAKKMNKPHLQPPIHRFVRGEVENPEPTTAGPLANYFNLPLEAIYDEKRATAIAKERGIEALPEPPEAPRRKRGATVDRDLAARIASMTTAEREHLWEILGGVPGGKRFSRTPAKTVKPKKGDAT